jgi:hypothetical protein
MTSTDMTSTDTTGAKRMRFGRMPRLGTALTIVLAGAVGTAAMAFAAMSADAAPASVSPQSQAVGLRGEVHFSDNCRYSHEANDDPILDPGQTGASMAHDFFGNTTTSATSTATTLVNGSTTCSTSADASAYWAPVLYQNGQAITPRTNDIYWQTPRAQTAQVVAPPAGLEMIAGNENASSPQSVSVVRWGCAPILAQAAVRQTASDVPVNCPNSRGLRLTVTFPSCWDGKTLGGAAQTNVVYPEATGCPSTNPVRIPTVIFHVVYPITSAAGLTLSMGPGMQGSVDTAHGDFINGWNQTDLARDITTCSSGQARRCGVALGPDAQLHQLAMATR